MKSLTILLFIYLEEKLESVLFIYLEAKSESYWGIKTNNLLKSPNQWIFFRN